MRHLYQEMHGKAQRVARSAQTPPCGIEAFTAVRVETNRMTFSAHHLFYVVFSNMLCYVSGNRHSRFFYCG